MDMKGKSLNVKWYGQAGRSADEAAVTLARVLAAEGKYVQAFPDIKCLPASTPATAFNRISNYPLRVRSRVLDSDVEILLESDLLKYLGPRGRNGNGGSEGPIYIVNTPLTPVELQERFGFSSDRLMTFDSDSRCPYILPMALLVNRLGLLPPQVFKDRLEKILSSQMDKDEVEEQLNTLDGTLAEAKES